MINPPIYDRTRDLTQSQINDTILAALDLMEKEGVVKINNEMVTLN